MEKISSSFPSDVLQLLSLNSVTHRGSWTQQTKAAAEQHRLVSVFCPALRCLRTPGLEPSELAV